MVLADGCFDPLHIGHVRYLMAAMKACNGSEGLAVRVAPDAAIADKGRAAFQTRRERAECIALLLPVVELCYDDQLARTISRVKPRLLVKGWDWFGRLPDDVVAACEESGTAVMFTQTQERTSTERLG